MASVGIRLRLSIFLSWILCLLTVGAQSLSPITAQGSKFFNSEGKQFYIKGMVYNLGPGDAVNVNNTFVDVLADPVQCALDAPLMKTLLVNTIRVYAVDNARNHTECMKSFEENGIYVLLGLWTPHAKIDSRVLIYLVLQHKPDWNQTLFSHFTETLAEFSQYDNLLAVDIGSEVISDDTQYGAAPYIRAAARDVKAYRDAQKMRKIPVGYCSSDLGADTISDTRDYLGCGGDNSTTVDFFALNRYSWCGQSSFTESLYSDLYRSSLDSPLPLFFSETGCNAIGDRTFDDQVAVLGPEMNEKWSGAVIYEWGEQANKYGIVSYPSAGSGTASSDFGSSGTPTPISPDFYSLQSQWDTLTPTGLAQSTYSPTETTPKCPTFAASGWNVKPSASLPTIKNLVIPTKTIASGRESAPAVSTSHGKVIPVTNTPSSSNSSSTLSTGAQAAIGVVIPLAFIALAAAAFFIWRRKKAKKDAAETTMHSQVQQMQEHKNGVEADGASRAQLHGDDARVEPDSSMRYQLSDEARVVPELRSDADVVPQELSSGPSVRRQPRRLSYEAP